AVPTPADIPAAVAADARGPATPAPVEETTAASADEIAAAVVRKIEEEGRGSRTAAEWKPSMLVPAGTAAKAICLRVIDSGLIGVKVASGSERQRDAKAMNMIDRRSGKRIEAMWDDLRGLIVNPGGYGYELRRGAFAKHELQAVEARIDEMNKRLAEVFGVHKMIVRLRRRKGEEGGWRPAFSTNTATIPTNALPPKKRWTSILASESDEEE
ncbi:MAG: hypothetical protein ACRELB_06580, partial [Polyangiaceae bacterium]